MHAPPARPGEDPSPTRRVEYQMAGEKASRAVVPFGARSTTAALDGELTPGEGRAPDRAAAEAGLGAFRGRISQVPPDYSAVRIAGRRAYELARGGEKPPLQRREGTLHPPGPP